MSRINLKYKFLKLLGKAAVLSDLSEVGRSLLRGPSLPRELRCQLPAPLFTVLGGAPAIKSVHGLPACPPFAPGAHDNKAEVDPFCAQAPAGGFTEAGGLSGVGTRCYQGFQ